MIKRIFFVLIFLSMCFTPVFSQEDFNSYIKTVKFEMQKAWNPPVYKYRYTSEVGFKINKDGSVSDVKLIKSSKIPKMDKMAIETVKNLPKFERFPSFYIGEFVDVRAGLTNYIRTDLKNPNIYQKQKNIKQSDIIPVNTKRVKYIKFVYDEFFQNGESNFEDNMKEMVLNLDIQRALRN